MPPPPAKRRRLSRAHDHDTGGAERVTAPSVPDETPPQAASLSRMSSAELDRLFQTLPLEDYQGGSSPVLPSRDRSTLSFEAGPISVPSQSVPLRRLSKRLSENGASDDLLFQNMGLDPDRIRQMLLERGINGLYDWQRRCLALEEVRNGQNLLYALPTSSGKTLVAEVREYYVLARELLIQVIYSLISLSDASSPVMTPSDQPLSCGFVASPFEGCGGLEEGCTPDIALCINCGGKGSSFAED